MTLRSSYAVEPADLEAAARRIGPFAHRTPVLTCSTIDEHKPFFALMQARNNDSCVLKRSDVIEFHIGFATAIVWRQIHTLRP